MCKHNTEVDEVSLTLESTRSDFDSFYISLALNGGVSVLQRCGIIELSVMVGGRWTMEWILQLLCLKC